MANTFHLQIITPERVFIDDQAEMVVVTAPDGEYGIAAGHSPVIVSTEEGEIRINRNGEWRVAAASDGTATVTPDYVLVMLQTVEWPEEIDERRARESEERAREIMRQKCSMQEYVMAKSMLSRALVRLRVAGNTPKND